MCVCVYKNQYLPSFTYFKKLLNNGFELVLRVVVVALINFTLLSRAAMLVVVVAAVVFVIVAHIVDTHTQARTLQNTG